MNSIPVCSRASSKFGGASEQVLYLWSDPPNGVSKYIGPGSPAVSMWIVTEPRSCQIPEILSFASNQVDYRRALCPGRHAVGEGTVWKCTVFLDYPAGCKGHGGCGIAEPIQPVVFGTLAS